tara:strand:- start:162 stop:752 length:591 start_codon:yes stop_codon:yes gene_type:complete
MNLDTAQPTISVFVGMPGSGKSTARERASKRAGVGAPDKFHYSTDDIVERVATSLGVNYDDVWQDYIKSATAEADAGVTKAIEQKQDVVWDQTNLTAKKRSRILAKFGDYHKTCICILPAHTQLQRSEIKYRLASRSGKQIPQFVITNMFNSFVLPTLDEGFDSVLFLDIFGQIVSVKQAEAIFQDIQNKKQQHTM